MKGLRLVAIVVLALMALSILGAHYLAPAGYEQQFRELPQAARAGRTRHRADPPERRAAQLAVSLRCGVHCRWSVPASDRLERGA